MAQYFRIAVLALCCAALAAAAAEGSAPGADAREAGFHPERPGLLVIASGCDTTLFRWAPAGDDGTRALVWDGGSLTLGPAAETGRYGPADLTLPFGTSLTGVSEGRRLIFAEGRYPVEKTLLLKGRDFQLTVHRGELEIMPGRIRYSDRKQGGGRAQYLLLAGVLLLTVSLLARARSRLRES